MKSKTLFAGVMILALILVGSFIKNANSQNFTISATIPSASGVNFTVYKITPSGNTETFEVVNTTNLNFGTLTFDTENSIFLPAFSWGIDVVPNGSGTPDVQIKYANDQNANQGVNSREGLMAKGLLFVQKVVNQGDDPDLVTNIQGLDVLGNFTGAGQTINETAITPGVARVRVGLATGDPDNDEPAEAEPFSAADVPGTYSGTLTITATFD